MGRTILVGDIHGCAGELDDLLTRVNYAQGVDQLVLVGDLVARGPDSRGVIERVGRYGARAVRGNHDERVLTWWRAAQGLGRRAAWRTVRLSPRHEAVVRSLTPMHFKTLAALPLTLALPEHGVLVVHAGIDPARPPEEASEEVLLTVRSVDDKGVPTRRVEGTPWARLWGGPLQMVFGHDARRGLQIEPFATGLDTGCCYGRTLTAMVLEAGEPVPVDPVARRSHLVSVPARSVYCGMGNGEGAE